MGMRMGIDLKNPIGMGVGVEMISTMGIGASIALPTLYLPHAHPYLACCVIPNFLTQARI